MAHDLHLDHLALARLGRSVRGAWAPLCRLDSENLGKVAASIPVLLDVSVTPLRQAS